jgi:Flp pilus assembly pilin Flp
MIYYKKKIQQDVGATAIEYGLLSALIAITTIVALQSTGTNLGTTYCTIANELSQAVGAGSTASGCSATSSSSSSSSSADSSGSSADSSGSSSSGSSADSSGTSSDSSSSSSSSSSVYSASNAYTIGGSGARGATIDSLLMNMDHSGETINGIYDADGNALTTSEDIASYLGIQSEYDAFNDANNGYPKGTATSEDVSNALTALNTAIADTTTQIYIPDPTTVSTSGTPYAIHYISQKAGFGAGAGTTTYKYGTGTSATSTLVLVSPSGN